MMKIAPSDSNLGNEWKIEKAIIVARAFTFLVLDLGLDIVDGVAGLDLESDGFPG